MILFRGMNLKEREQFELGNFNNISWWSDIFNTSRLYSKGALVKVDLDITESDRTYFKNAIHGRDVEYEGYGQNPQEEHFFSISGNLLKSKMKSYEFYDINDIMPNTNDNLNVIKDNESYEVMYHILSKNGEINHEYAESVSGDAIKDSVDKGAIFLYTKNVVQLFMKK